MSRKEAPRAGLVKAALAGHVTNAQAAQALALTVRQFQRLKRRFRADGVHGLIHRLRGQPSPRRLAAPLRERVAALLLTTYQGFNDCHLTEKLQEVEGLPVSRSSVRRIRRALGLAAKHRRRPRPHRHRRTPEPRMGSLVQLDASLEAWLETRGPALTLHGAIDDAGSRALALVFRPTEDLHGYTVVLAQLARAYGLPVAFYGDRLNVFVRNDAHWSLAEQLHGEREPTHFGRLLRDLGIGFIAAGSPQAKGRVERLWGTLQDRLVSELRLRRISSLEAANAYLPEFLADFNRRFARAPADPIPAWRRPPRDLAERLSLRYTRTVARDNTVRLGERWVQIPPGPGGRSYAGCRVDVRECLDGRLLVFYTGAAIATQPAPDGDFILKPRSDPSAERARRLRGGRTASSPGGRYGGSGRNGDLAPPSAVRATTGPWRPPATHPWRRPFTRRRRGQASPSPGVTFSLNS